MALCFNTNDPLYKEILELHGPSTPFLLNAMMDKTGITKVPTLSQLNAYLNKNQRGMLKRLIRNLNFGEGYTVDQIVRNLRGVVHYHNGNYYVTKGFTSQMSLAQQAEARKMVFEDNMNTLTLLQQHFPNTFTIEKYGNNKYSYRVLINNVQADPSKYVFSNFVTDSGKTLVDLEITKDEFDSLNESEREALKKCN